MWSNLSILQSHYNIITKLINPLNCTLPPSDMHQCVSDYMWPLLQYFPALSKLYPAVIPRFPSFHHLGLITVIIPSFMSFSLSFIFLFSITFLPLYPSAYNSSLLRPPLPPLLCQTNPHHPSPCLIRIGATEGLLRSRGQSQEPESNNLFISDWLTHSAPPPDHHQWPASIWLTNDMVIENKLCTHTDLMDVDPTAHRPEAKTCLSFQAVFSTMLFDKCTYFVHISHICPPFLNICYNQNNPILYLADMVRFY